eukprot:1147447-Pelagomonas_calceolata.AAC.15
MAPVLVNPDLNMPVRVVNDASNKGTEAIGRGSYDCIYKCQVQSSTEELYHQRAGALGVDMCA